jgi:zinc protease
MALNPLRQTLPNGVVTLSKETRTTPAVTMLVGVRAGTFYDPVGREGTAALVARVLDRGTERHGPDALADELDGRGASLSVMAGRHQAIVSATCLAEDFDAVFGIVADVTRRPRFDPDQVEIRRAELLTAIQQDEDDPAAVAVDVLMGRLYARHPYGRRPRGTVASVSSLTRDEIVAYHRRWFTPNGTTIVVVGDVDADTVLAAVARAFAEWDAPRPSESLPPPVNAASSRALAVVPMMNKAQADVAYANVGVRRIDPEYYPAWVMNNALGQYALGGRLGDSIRERQGMAYYVSSSLDASLGAGPLMIRAGVAPDNVARTLASIDHELTFVRDEGITPKEFRESKQYLIGSIPRQLETNAGIAGFLLNVELFELGSDHDARLPRLIEAVTLDEVNRMARRLLDPARASIVVAGPWTGPGDGRADIAGPSRSVISSVRPDGTPIPA